MNNNYSDDFSQHLSQTYKLVIITTRCMDFNDIHKIMRLPIMDQFAYPLYLFRESISSERSDYTDVVDKVPAASEFHLKQEHIDVLLDDDNYDNLFFSSSASDSTEPDKITFSFHPTMRGAWARGEVSSPEFIVIDIWISEPLKLQPLINEEFMVKFISEIMKIVPISRAYFSDFVWGEDPIWLKKKRTDNNLAHECTYYVYNGIKLSLELEWITYLSKDHVDAIGRKRFRVLEDGCNIIEVEQGTFIVVKTPFSRLNEASYEKLRAMRRKLAETT